MSTPERWTPSERVKANIAAMELAVELNTDERQPTADERAVLVGYSGWGSLDTEKYLDRFPKNDASMRDTVLRDLSAPYRVKIIWDKLNWDAASAAWREKAWGRYGADVGRVFSGLTSWYAKQIQAPVLRGGKLTIGLGTPFEQILPQTKAGWDEYLRLAPASGLTFTSLLEGGLGWWNRRVPPNLLSSAREKAEGKPASVKVPSVRPASIKAPPASAKPSTRRPVGAPAAPASSRRPAAPASARPSSQRPAASARPAPSTPTVSKRRHELEQVTGGTARGALRAAAKRLVKDLRAAAAAKEAYRGNHLTPDGKHQVPEWALLEERFDKARARLDELLVAHRAAAEQRAIRQELVREGQQDLFARPAPASARPVSVKPLSVKTLPASARAQTSPHLHRDSDKLYADTTFLNYAGQVPGYSVRHLGFGEFVLETPFGDVEFDRMRGEDFPGQVGRPHLIYGSPAAVADMLAKVVPMLAAEAAKLASTKVPSVKSASTKPASSKPSSNRRSVPPSGIRPSIRVYDDTDEGLGAELIDDTDEGLGAEVSFDDASEGLGAEIIDDTDEGLGASVAE